MKGCSLGCRVTCIQNTRHLSLALSFLLFYSKEYWKEVLRLLSELRMMLMESNY